VLLVLASRVAGDFNDPAIEGVYATIEERPRPQARARQPLPTPRSSDPGAAPAFTPAPVDRAMLARSLACLRPRAAERPPTCPPLSEPPRGGSFELPVGGDFAQPEELDLNEVYTPAELRTLVTPSCRRDGGGGACIPVGPPPPPPSRSGEELCEAEGVGPCSPPPFREEDVRPRQHTQ
jgi:hypothetical protein